MVSQRPSPRSGGLRAMAQTALLVSSLLVPAANGDGTGILGAGKWLYRPVCAHSCRRLFNLSPLLCQESVNGTDSADQETQDPTPECHLMDAAYMRTLALCIDTYCPKAHDLPRLSEIEDYWEGHLATGSVGDRSLAMAPVRSYGESLRLAHLDMDEIGHDNMLTAVNGEPINQTSLVDEDVWESSYVGQYAFQEGEFDHGRNSLAVGITICAIPILVSLFRFLPAHSVLASRIAVCLDQPFVGRRYRVPVAGNLGIMPTRAQALFIAYIVLINIVLGVFPLKIMFPNFTRPTALEQGLGVVGDRTGVLAMADFVALFLFSSRNNVLLWITNWSHSTFLLLHRWVAYCCIMQAVVHSVLLLVFFDHVRDTHEEESQLEYWYWGIVATLALCIMWTASILPVRQRVYQLFLSLHQVLAALALVATFLHIWFLFEYNWGYEIWVYVAGGIWFLDWVLRVLRMASNGMRTAAVTVVGVEGEYLRVQIKGIAADGHVYLYFPTLSWKIWESHPFSVMSSFTGTAAAPIMLKAASAAGANSSSSASADPEKSPANALENQIVRRANSSSSYADDDEEAIRKSKSMISPSASVAVSTATAQGPIRPCTTLLVRSQDGATRLLASRALASGGNNNNHNAFTLPVLVEGSYDANPSVRKLSHCSTLLCIAGGVGITAVLPMARHFGGVRTKFCWGVRTEDLLRAAEPEIAQLRSGRVAVETRVGARLNVAGIVGEELLKSDEEGELGIAVCGPPGMADECRRVIGEVVGSGRVKRGVVFIDEAFSW